MSMRGEARKELDRIEQLEVGRGMLEAYAFGGTRGLSPFDFSRVVVGGGLEYSHRITRTLSAFARGEVAHELGANIEWSALGGLRWRF